MANNFEKYFKFARDFLGERISIYYVNTGEDVRQIPGNLIWGRRRTGKIPRKNSMWKGGGGKISPSVRPSVRPFDRPSEILSSDDKQTDGVPIVCGAKIVGGL